MPSPYTLEQLRAEFTLDDATTEVLEQLQFLGFETSSWQTGSRAKTMVLLFAFVYWKLREFITALTYMAYNSDASGGALTELSDSHFDNQRTLAVAAQYNLKLTGGAAGPPYTVAIDEVVASDGTRTYRNKEAGTIPASGNVTLLFEAEVAGIDGNVGDNTITSLITPLAGVSVTNEAGSLVTAGANEEDDESLQERNTAKWATLSTVESIADRFEYIAREVVANCRVAVDDSNPGGPGTVYIYLAAEDGTATAGEVTLVDNAIDAQHFGGVHTTIAATQQTLTVTATVYFAAGAVSATVEAAVVAAIDAYLNSAPIGGYDYSPGPSGVIRLGELYTIINGVEDVESVTIASPSADVNVTDYYVVVGGTHVLTMVEVTS